MIGSIRLVTRDDRLGIWLRSKVSVDSAISEFSLHGNWDFIEWRSGMAPIRRDSRLTRAHISLWTRRSTTLLPYCRESVATMQFLLIA
jgi:hypothetical protein